MFKLVGFAASNYYNKVKLALIEKGVSFEEELAWIGQTDPAASPVGKVPYAITEDGPLSESTVILEYLEAKYPAHPLLPADPYAAARVRELVRYMELHLELTARNLYAEAFFGGQVSDGLKKHVEGELRKYIAGFAKLARFDTPFIAGEQFTLADCAAVVHLPLVCGATKTIYGQDFLGDLPVGAYLKRMAERPSVQRVEADRRSNLAAMAVQMKGKK